MGFFSKLFSKDEPKDKIPEHAFIVTLKLSDEEFGTEAERTKIHELTDKIDEAIIEAKVGEFDGDEFGDGKCLLYMYGPDANALYLAVDSVLRESPLSKGAVGVKRFGEPDDENAKEEIVYY